MHWCIRFCVLSSSTGQGAHATRIHSQYGGQFLCMDGTWRIGLRVIDSPDCLFFLLGEDAKVHAYGAVQSERKEEIYLLLKRYAERRRRNGTLLALEWLYDDLCCRGADHVHQGVDTIVRTSFASTSASTPPPASKRARGDRDRASERSR
ncbi:unnamed protein product [Ectocarpus sp. CCAP 1310/34]|nr:unnamed protein product [Ectocarpus sp. CCAP 1310/34]